MSLYGPQLHLDKGPLATMPIRRLCACALQAQVHRKSEQHLFRELLLGGGPPS